MSTPHNSHDDKHRSDSPIVQLIVSMSGGVAPEHETEPPGADKVSVQAGHEPDQFGIKGIIMVPVFIIGLMAFCTVLVTVIFFAIYDRFHTPAADAHPQALNLNTVVDKEGNRQSRDINDRFERISSMVPNAPVDAPNSAVPQPRLEYLKQSERETKQDPSFERSKRPVDTLANSPEIRPEDLRPERYVDPQSREKTLITTAWLDPKKTVARIPIKEAMKLVLANKKLPVRKDAVKLQDIAKNNALMSNAGRGGVTGPAQSSKDAKPADAKPADVKPIPVEVKEKK